MHELLNYLGQTSVARESADTVVGEYDLLAVRFNRNKLISFHGTVQHMSWEIPFI